MQQVLDKLILQLQKRRLKVATAESCTGGLVAKLLTDRAGASAWFDTGFVVYSGKAKQRQLDVSEAIIRTAGEVSRRVVTEMAEGAIKQSNANVALAITGLAGPGGGSKEKPLGMVWIGWSGKNYETETRCFHFDGDRDDIRQQAAKAAMDGLVHYIVKNA